MDNLNNNLGTGSAYTGSAGTTVYDEGLRTHMIRMYNAVAGGLGISAIAAYLVYTVPDLGMLFINPVASIVLLLATFGLLWFGLSPNRLMQQSVSAVRTKYFLFTGLLGISLAPIFTVYTGDSVVRVFMITAAMFAGMSLYGYTTKRSLAAMGSFLMMGLIGIVIASLVNIFLHSSGMSFVISIVGVLVFTGLTAWETQTAKRMYNAGNVDEMNQKLAISSAVGLYLNFLNLFQMLLNLLGDRR